MHNPGIRLFQRSWTTTKSDLICLIAPTIPQTFASTFISINDFVNELIKKNNDVLCVFTKGTI